MVFPWSSSGPSSRPPVPKETNLAKTKRQTLLSISPVRRVLSVRLVSRAHLFFPPNFPNFIYFFLCINCPTDLLKFPQTPRHSSNAYLGSYLVDMYLNCELYIQNCDNHGCDCETPPRIPRMQRPKHLLPPAELYRILAR